MRFSCLPMQRTDMGRVLEIERVCFAEPWTRAMLAGELLLGHSRAMALRIAGGLKSEIIGYLFFHLVADEMHVLEITVAPECRRCGGAGQLMRAGMSTAAGKGALKAFLEVRASNTAAIAFYEGLCFERVGRRPAYYRNPDTEDAIIMRKTLKRRVSWL